MTDGLVADLIYTPTRWTFLEAARCMRQLLSWAIIAATATAKQPNVWRAGVLFAHYTQPLFLFDFELHKRQKDVSTCVSCLMPAKLNEQRDASLSCKA